jgi:hypothetical protein
MFPAVDAVLLLIPRENHCIYGIVALMGRATTRGSVHDFAKPGNAFAGNRSLTRSWNRNRKVRNDVGNRSLTVAARKHAKTSLVAGAPGFPVIRC